jgi:hypothetical protein
MSQGRHENASFSHDEGARGDPDTTTASHDYRARAARLRVLAARSPDPLIRTYLVTTAAQFERLADYAAAAGARTAAA